MSRESELPRLDRSEAWLSNVLQSEAALTLEDLGQSSQWGRTMEAALPDEELDRMLGLGRTRGYLFAGPWGSGRKTVALATAGSLMGRGYQSAYLARSDFAGLSLDACTDALQELCARMGPYEPFCLVCDEVGQWDHSAPLCDLLADCMAVIRQEDLPVFLIVIAEGPEEVGRRLAGQLDLCAFQLPDEEERRAFFEKRVDRFLPLKVGFTHRELARESRGLNYHQLNALLKLMRLTLKGEAIRAEGHDTKAIREAFLAQTVRIDQVKFRALAEQVRLKGSTPAVAPAPAAAPYTPPAPHPQPAAAHTPALGDTRIFAVPHQGYQAMEVHRESPMDALRSSSYSELAKALQKNITGVDDYNAAEGKYVRKR